MPRSINNHDNDWRREWEEEQQLTPEEQKEADKLKAMEDAQTAQILEDLRMCELEARMEEDAHKLRLLRAKNYLRDRGWSDTSIWVLSDTELLEAADAAAEREWEEDAYDYNEDSP